MSDLIVMVLAFAAFAGMFPAMVWLRNRAERRKFSGRQAARIMVGWESSDNHRPVKNIAADLAFRSIFLDLQEGFFPPLIARLSGRTRRNARALCHTLLQWQQARQKIQEAPNTVTDPLPLLREVESAYRKIVGFDENVGFMMWDQARAQVALDSTHVQNEPKQNQPLSPLWLYERASDAIRTQWRPDGASGFYPGPDCRPAQFAQCRLELAGYLQQLGEVDQAETWLRKTLAELERLENETLKEQINRQLKEVLSGFDETEQEIRSHKWALSNDGRQLGWWCPDQKVAIERLTELLIGQGRLDDAQDVINLVLENHKSHNKCRTFVSAVGCLGLVIGARGNSNLAETIAELIQKLS